jgi:hypothetical protein
VDTTKELPTVLSFCSGYGGIERGLDLAGFEHRVIAYVEIKPSAVKTWQRRWKTSSWMPRLYGRILKPSQHMSFETKLTSSLEGIRVSPSPQQDNEKEQTTHDTCGPTSKNTSEQFDLFGSSLRTSKVTSVLDSEKSLATWKASVTKQRGEYSQRVKLAPLTRESESTSWPTPIASDGPNMIGSKEAAAKENERTKGGVRLSGAVLLEPTSWPTATVFDVTGGSYPTELVNGQWRSKHSKDPNSPWYGAKLRDAVETAEKMNWPTPSTSEIIQGW